MRPFVTGDGVGREAIVAMETGGRLRLATCYARDAGNLLVCFDVAGAAGAVHGWLLAEACLQRAPDADAERCLEEEEREADAAECERDPERGGEEPHAGAGDRGQGEAEPPGEFLLGGSHPLGPLVFDDEAAEGEGGGPAVTGEDPQHHVEHEEHAERLEGLHGPGEECRGEGGTSEEKEDARRGPDCPLVDHRHGVAGHARADARLRGRGEGSIGCHGGLSGLGGGEGGEKRGEFLHEHERAHDEYEDAESLAECALRYPPREGDARERARDRGRGEREHNGPVQLHREEVAAEPGEGFHGDDQQRGADRDGHGEAAEEVQGGHDEEPAARADEAGGDADEEPVEQDPRESRFVLGVGVLCGLVIPAADHRGRGDDHHDREQHHQDRARDESADDAARERPGHARDTEEQPGLPSHPPRFGVTNHADGAGRAHDEEGRGDRFARWHAEHVGEDGDGED